MFAGNMYYFFRSSTYRSENKQFSRRFGTEKVLGSLGCDTVTV